MLINSLPHELYSYERQVRLSRDDYSFHPENRPPFPAPCISHCIEDLKKAGTKALLLDWDGCMMPLCGEWHACVAYRALELSPTFQKYASVTMQETTDAYEGPFHGIDWFALFKKGLIQPKIEKALENSSEMEKSEEIIYRCVAEFTTNFNIACREFGSGKVGGQYTLEANSGTEDFLQSAANHDLELHVVSMTPTALVLAFAERTRLFEYIDTFQGCDKFSEYPEGKINPELWRTAAVRLGFDIENCCIVEDSPKSLQGAILSKPAGVISMKNAFMPEQINYHSATRLWHSKIAGDFLTLSQSKI